MQPSFLAILLPAVLGLGIWWWFRIHATTNSQGNPEGVIVKEQSQEQGHDQGRFQDPLACDQILKCKGYGTGDENELPAVESRAIPNERLVRAFGIDNAFTTSNDQYRKQFSKEASRMIKKSDEQWKEIAALASTLVRDGIPTSGKIPSAPLEDLVRSVVFKITLHALFEAPPSEVDEETIFAVTTAINELWKQSKTSDPQSEPDKIKLRSALRNIFPNMDSNQKKNPLNLIIPAYETTWRVVLSCFIEVAFVKTALPAWKPLLLHYLANPSKHTLEERSNSDGAAVSVAFIVKEALRLYPTVKRVYRQFHMKTKETPELVAADVEACHRALAVWGDDALRFMPSRWLDPGKEAESAYMPFGAGQFFCPAKTDFGPRMIGVLVAAFTENISSDGWRLELDDSGRHSEHFERALNGDEPLVSDRSTYAGVKLVRKIPSI